MHTLLTYVLTKECPSFPSWDWCFGQYVYFFLYTFIIVGHRPKPVYLTYCQLSFAHLMMVLTGGDMWLTDIFESLNIENDFKCKTIFYISRVMRGISICITCLLSVFQAVTISPSNSLMAKFKNKLKKYIIDAFFFIWLFSLTFSGRLIFYVGGFTNVSETNQMKVTKSCSLFPKNYIIKEVIVILTIFRDVFLIGVMMTTSAYMVIILFRHQRQCKLLHSISHLRVSPEKRATQTILMVVVFFVIIYWVDFIISSTSILVWKYDPFILTVQKFVMNPYPAITPLIQISYNKRIIRMLKILQAKCH